MSVFHNKLKHYSEALKSDLKGMQRKNTLWHSMYNHTPFNQSLLIVQQEAGSFEHNLQILFPFILEHILLC